MIILIGSLPGSGARLLARRLADDLHYFFYPLRKKIVHELTNVRAITYGSQYKPNAKTINDFRLKTLKEVAEELPMLVKMHSGLIIVSPFLRKKERDFFFHAAKKADTTLIVWVDASSDDALKRFNMKRRLVNPDLKIETRKRMEQRFEPFDFPHLLFNNTGAINDSPRHFREMILVEMKRLENENVKKK